MLRHHDRGATLDRRPVVAQPGDERGELRERSELGLRLSMAIRQAEVHLEAVVPVGVLAREVVVVAVVPRDPAPRACEKRRMEDLPVVVGGVVVRDEVRRDAELLEDDRLPESTRQLADERRGEGLPDVVVLHRIDVWPDEVHERREIAERVAVVLPGDLDPPGAVSERERLCRPRRAYRLADDPRPRRDLVRRGRAAVERHLVRHEPSDDRCVRAEPLRRSPRRATPAGRRATRRGRDPCPASTTGPSSHPTCARRRTSGSSRGRTRCGRRESRSNRSSTSASSVEGAGMKSGQKQNDRVTFSPWAARTASSSRTTVAS